MKCENRKIHSLTVSVLHLDNTYQLSWKTLKSYETDKIKLLSKEVPSIYWQTKNNIYFQRQALLVCWQTEMVARFSSYLTLDQICCKVTCFLFAVDAQNSHILTAPQHVTRAVLNEQN